MGLPDAALRVGSEGNARFLSPFSGFSVILILSTWGPWITRLRRELCREICAPTGLGRLPSGLHCSLLLPLTCSSPTPAQRPGQTTRGHLLLTLQSPECERPGLC